MAKPVLVSGIQPSGRLHIGNYLGALKNFVELQDSGKYECYFFIADLHSLTEAFDPKEKPKQILELVADFLAAGLNPRKSTIFQQSQSPSHTELAWILGTLTPMGDLRRMTQFKEKSEGEKETSNIGLFYYPVLMAADILFCDAKFVPVGHDQLQHLELTRTLARKFNSKFGRTFVEPQPLLTKTPRVMSLMNPEKKMSKSQPEGCLFLDDSPEEIKKKIGRAVTDSGSEVKYDREKKPGVSNLLEILSSFTGKPILQLEKKFRGKNYATFKAAVAEEVSEKLAKFRSKKAELRNKTSALRAVLVKGSGMASVAASKKIQEAKKRIGIAL
ncbi:tryptophan--tRNA ligase [Candidatus Parcubacteria bacterium]|nr:MAG: tryptophan--tRNA ligase [Candidatus Parcubacteria bacterium]